MPTLIPADSPASIARDLRQLCGRTDFLLAAIAESAEHGETALAAEMLEDVVGPYENGLRAILERLRAADEIEAERIKLQKEQASS